MVSFFGQCTPMCTLIAANLTERSDDCHLWGDTWQRYLLVKALLHKCKSREWHMTWPAGKIKLPKTCRATQWQTSSPMYSYRTSRPWLPAKKNLHHSIALWLMNPRCFLPAQWRHNWGFMTYPDLGAQPNNTQASTSYSPHFNLPLKP